MTDHNAPDKGLLQPLISVLLPVYNGAPYLRGAIESILGQSYATFELIIINDGSRDDSAEIIASFSDTRIRSYHQENQGLAATLNRGIGLAAGEIIVRQDQDDISLPQRFMRQVEFLQAHPRCAMVGTWAEIWVDDQRTDRAHRHPVDNAMIQLELLFTNPFVHSSVMIRTKCLQEVGGYAVDPTRQPPEDYELWSRIARTHEVANIPECLVIYREVGGSMSRSTNPQFWERVVNICQENIQAVLGCDYNREPIRGVVRLYHGINDHTRRPRTKELVILMRDIADAFETRYPEHCRQVRVKLTSFFTISLHCHYARSMGATLARLLVKLRSLWLFR